MREEKQVAFTKKTPVGFPHGNIPIFFLKMLDHILTNSIHFSDATSFL